VFTQRHEVRGYSHTDLPVEKVAQVEKAFESFRPDLVVHSAAYTKVDDCERNIEKAYQVNALGTRNVALAAQRVGAKLLYISTDYVFDGEKDKPYLEYDSPNPLNIYGKSKLAGEWYVQTLLLDFFIVRTSWLFGLNGQNFVKTILKLAKKDSALKVVKDQIGSPTYAFDLAQKVSELVETSLYGVYHITNQGTCSWFEFAQKILELSGVEKEITPVSSEEFPRPAKRPKYAVLKNFVLEKSGFSLLRSWEEALAELLKQLPSF
jgi:dTDP-4-dehydrorhamnose reductase